MSGTPDTIYKIFRVHEWTHFQATGNFAGSPDDLRDGFIHCSTAEQLRETAEKHFASEREIVMAAIDSAALGDAVKWEISRGGKKFPHLYASLPLNAVGETALLSRDAEGRYIFPKEIV